MDYPEIIHALTEVTGRDARRASAATHDRAPELLAMSETTPEPMAP